MKKRILILAANPSDTMPLRLGKETREIKNGLRGSQFRDDFELDQQYAVRTKEVQRAMLDFKPNIVHFCGHGAGEAGIIFEDDAGFSHLVTAEALANFFSLFADQVECVVLNACYSEVQARAIAQHIPYVIGMRQGIEDQLAISFATAFYDALGAGKPTDFAYRLGCSAIQMVDISKELVPVLITQKDVTLRSYDILISCTQKDQDWVNQHLYSCLLRCKLPNGQHPEIYYNVAKATGDPAHNLIASLENLWQALQGSKHIIPVYTRAYFEDKETNWELKKIVELHIYNEQKKIHPVLADLKAEIPPFYNSTFGFLSTSAPQWFAELVRVLGLTYELEAKPIHVVFADQPNNITVKQTLPAITIETRDENGPVNLAGKITLTAEKGELQGTLTHPLHNGRAVFTDLVLAEAGGPNRLQAQIPGYPPAFSQPFVVQALQTTAPTLRDDNHSRKQIPEKSKPVTISHRGEVVFWASGKALAIVRNGRIGVYDLKGNILGSEIIFNDRVRLAHSQADCLVVAGWAGEVRLIYDDGRHFAYSFAKHGGGFRIPSAVAFHAGEVLVSFWSGAVFCLTPGNAPVQVTTHEAGIHLLQWLPEGLAVCDLEGRLLILQNGRVIWTRPLEANVLLIQAFADCLVAVGEKKLYHLALQDRIFSEEAQLAAAVAAWGGPEYMLVIDGQGRGMHYNSDLTRQASFRTPIGARPRSADDQGNHYAFYHPISGWRLMINQQMIGPSMRTQITLAPHGDLAAVESPDGIKIIQITELQTLLLRASDHE